MNTETLGVYIIPESGADCPRLSTTGSACFDICARLYRPIIAYNTHNHKIELNSSDGGLVVPLGFRILVPTGLIFDIPIGFSVRLHSRSGLALKQGLVLANSEGIIDHDYTDELLVMLTSISESSIIIREGDRICQGELVKNQPTTIQYISNPPQQKTNRVGGFGSTGVS